MATQKTALFISNFTNITNIAGYTDGENAIAVMSS